MSEEKAVAPYDPDKLMDSVKARIRSEFASLIPDDAWKALVKKSVDGFFERKRGYHGEEASEFDRLVSNLVHEEVRNRMAKYFQTPEWTVNWDSEQGKKMMSEAVEKIIKDNVGEIVARTLGSAIQSVVTQMASNMQQQRY